MAKTKSEWTFFEKFAKFVDANNNVIDWKKFIEVLARRAGGWYNPRELCSLKSIKIYKTLVELDNKTDDITKILDGITESIQYSAKLLIDRKLSHFDDLFDSNLDVMPIILTSISSGKMTYFFLAMCPNIKLKLTSFAPDLVDTFACEFLQSYDMTKSIILKSSKLVKIQNNFYKLINLAKDKINKDDRYKKGEPV